MNVIAIRSQLFVRQILKFHTCGQTPCSCMRVQGLPVGVVTSNNLIMDHVFEMHIQLYKN